MAVPAALASHFICDAIPHFKFQGEDAQTLRQRFFVIYLLAEAGLCGLLVLALGLAQPLHWVLAAICAFVAASPDLLSIRKFVLMRQGKPWRPTWYGKFAGGIQWFERPIGLVVELAWLVAVVAILSRFW